MRLRIAKQHRACKLITLWGVNVNKNDLIARVAELSELANKDAAKAVDSVFEAITETLANKGEVRLVNFGNFVTVERAASKGRNPRTGEEINIAASTLPKFKPGLGLKKAVVDGDDKKTDKKPAKK